MDISKSNQNRNFKNPPPNRKSGRQVWRKVGAVATIGFPTRRCRDFRPRCWRTATTGEIASLSGAGDDPRYFQISVVFADGHHAAGQMAGRASSAGEWARQRDRHRVGQGACARPPMRQWRWRRAGRCRRSLRTPPVNYAVKSSLLLSFLESVPEVAAKLKEPNIKDESFGDVVKSAQDAAVLVLVY
jgi:hypothetical protein